MRRHGDDTLVRCNGLRHLDSGSAAPRVAGDVVSSLGQGWSVRDDVVIFGAEQRTGYALGAVTLLIDREPTHLAS